MEKQIAMGLVKLASNDRPYDEYLSHTHTLQLGNLLNKSKTQYSTYLYGKIYSSDHHQLELKSI